jgi:AbrB family looped-hinge helix DNA binding protein
MTKTRVSPSYEVVIPKEIREGLALRPGQDLQIIRKGNVIMLVPDRPISAFRGILSGVAAADLREKKDRF